MIEYLNENPGVGIIIAVIAILVTIIGWNIKKARISKSNKANVRNVKKSDVSIKQKN